MGTYSSDGMYSTDYDSSEEEDNPKYCDSSSNESGELARRRMLFFSFSRNSNPLRIHDFFQVEESIGISITYLVTYGGFSIPRPAFPLLPNYWP